MARCAAWSSSPRARADGGRSLGRLASPRSSTRHTAPGTPRLRRSGGASRAIRSYSGGTASSSWKKGGRPQMTVNRVEASE
jgi:hypothetical protein